MLLGNNNKIIQNANNIIMMIILKSQVGNDRQVGNAKFHFNYKFCQICNENISSVTDESAFHQVIVV